ncbi:NAD-dependent succinate-semialdehyde dehydrogenase [Streptacidiphilus fuscans]|uniref:NAD-dependent succinate-semialdehyde dehydrogenase n=1 Tax=Streptacidiphilus fuscans TaxID=2789292 RepID=A0A931B8A4_9ACTN|nr:NAD-dependent succinate-semialdehyde dehydrogenase [Streptacidiphilus fuscans]MBF9072043.1 NAD-dependent succinate-semialdehyde dehydrogenase [Streptacidiphilus fuscans]
MDPEKIAAGPLGEGDLWLGGRWRAAADGRRFAVLDPATGRTVREVSAAGAADARAAMDAAAEAAPGWAATPARRRSEILHRTYELMTAHLEPLARLITLENGKALRDARAEVSYAAEFFRWFAEEAVRIDAGFGEAPNGGFRHLVQHRPVGITAHVTPWNFPAAMATRKIAPALAAGCPALLKPAPDTPLTALAVAELLAEAGLPDGVLQVLPTDRAAEVVGAWFEDERMRKFSFTGSTATGRLLLRQAAERVVNVTMELGGNAPFVVCADADLDAAVRGAMDAKMRGGGQVCIAANRFYVHASVAEEFTARFGAAMAEVVAGPGLAEGVTLGPLVNPAAVAKVRELVDDALTRGARIAAQGAVPEGGQGEPGEQGCFHPATVLVDVPDDARMLHEEVFGPVAPVSVFTDEDELVARANATPYGLAAYVFSRDLAHAVRLAERLEVGMVGVNRGLLSDPAAPFGGVKQSGLGREGGREGIGAFLETTYMAVDWP